MIPGEDPEEFEAFRSEFESAIAPVNVMKSELVDRIVLLKWKLRRIDRIEELEARFEFAMKILQSAKQEVVELASEMNHPCVWGVIEDYQNQYSKSKRGGAEFRIKFVDATCGCENNTHDKHVNFVEKYYCALEEYELIYGELPKFYKDEMDYTYPLRDFPKYRRKIERSLENECNELLGLR